MLLLRVSRFAALRQPLNTLGLGKTLRRISTFPAWSEGYDALRIAKMKEWKAHASRSAAHGDPPSKKQRLMQKRAEQGSHSDILDCEVMNLLARQPPPKDPFVSSTDGPEPAPKVIQPQKPAKSAFDENSPQVELEIVELSSTGDGLALSESGDFVYVVPFSIPGDTVLARIPYQRPRDLYGAADFVKVIKPSPKRNDAGIKCKYFSTCSGCQLQMLPYQDQLAHKKTIIEKAYRFFSGLDPSLVPPVGDTVGSPLQYAYRTKLTPHFDGAARREGPRGEKRFTEVPPIGFSIKGRSKVMDIESCPIGTDIVSEGLTRERARVAKTIHKFTNGATILVRESTERVPRKEGTLAHLSGTSILEVEQTKVLKESGTGRPFIQQEYPKYTEIKTYTSNMQDTATEYIDEWKFTNRAGSFFQNNNSILSIFTAYVRDHAFPAVTATLTTTAATTTLQLPANSPSPSSSSSSSSSPPEEDEGAAKTAKKKPLPLPLKYLLDAYCGSGLFAITLSPFFKSALGIDIDNQAIDAARLNAQHNHALNTGFIEADAEALFVDVPFPSDETLVVIDPPRKGASLDFLQQLLHFGPKRVAYVSCNVHTQARDVGVLVAGNGKSRYEIESLRGFDFFPQTGHVEAVAFLNKLPTEAS